MFSKKATKNDKIFTTDLTLDSKCQIDGEDFFNFRGLLRKNDLYPERNSDAPNVDEKENSHFQFSCLPTKITTHWNFIWWRENKGGGMLYRILGGSFYQMS